MSNPAYKCSKISPKLATETLSDYISYQPVDIGFRHVDGNGRNVKICIIDSGYPSHHSIDVPASHTVDFTSSGYSALDVHGHGTAIAGMIKANGLITGLSPIAEIFYAKALDDRGCGSHGSVQAALLYSIIKKVDIVVMSFGSEVVHPSLHDVIKKAYANNISIFAAAGNVSGRTRDAAYPARFPEVMSIGASSSNSPKVGEQENYGIDFPSRSFFTLYPKNQYVKMGGASLLNAFSAGVASRLAQKLKENDGFVSPQKLYTQMMSLFSKQ